MVPSVAWGGGGHLWSLVPSESTAEEVGRGSLPIVIMPAVHFIKPVCDMSTLCKKENNNT